MSDWMRTADKSDGLTTEEKIAGYDYANEMQRRIRSELVDQADAREELERRLGECNAKRFLESGVAGVPPDRTWDVKCIHAHVADHLCRTSADDEIITFHGSVVRRGNVIGRKALQILQSRRGVPIHGNDVCWQQCDVGRDSRPGDWHYTPKKNRQKLRSTRLRRRELMTKFRDGDDGSQLGS